MSRQGAIGQRGDQHGREEGTSVRMCTPNRRETDPQAQARNILNRFTQKKNANLRRKKTEGTYDGNDDLTDQLIVELGVQLACVLSTLTNRNKSGYETKRKKPKGKNLKVGKKGSRVLRIGASKKFQPAQLCWLVETYYCPPTKT